MAISAPRTRPWLSQTCNPLPAADATDANRATTIDKASRNPAFIDIRSSGGVEYTSIQLSKWYPWPTTRSRRAEPPPSPARRKGITDGGVGIEATGCANKRQSTIMAHYENRKGDAMKRVDDFRLRLGKHELVPIMIGGMGVDISTAELALEAARLGGIGHISDAMVTTVTDRRYNTKFVKDKLKQYKYNVANPDKSVVQFDLGHARRGHPPARRARPWTRKRGDGLVFINCMEKLTMNAPKETLARAHARGAGCRHRRHHAGGRPAPGLVRADRGSPALSRRQARHHRFVAARAAAVPAQECPQQPPARLRGGRRPAGRRPPGLRHGLGAIRPGHHRRRDPRLAEGRAPRHSR